MKKKSFQLTMPSPCNRQWENLIPQTEELRYCTKCTKNIVDLTNKTDREIGILYKKSNGNICGRLRTDQLNRPILIPTNVAPLRLKAAGLLFSGLLTAGTLQAQTTTPISTEQTATISETNKTTYSTPHDFKNIKGKVIDKDNGEGLISVLISIRGKDGVKEVLTDLDGAFEAKVNFPITLNFDYVGYEPLTLELTEFSKEPLTIELTSSLNYPELTEFNDIVTESTREHIMVLGIIIERKEEEDKIPPPPLEEPSEVIIEPVILPPKLRTTIYPNPYKSKINIEIDVEEKTSFELLVTNESGQSLFKQEIEVEKGNNQFMINLKKYTLKSGTYFLSILEGGEVRQTKMIFKK